MLGLDDENTLGLTQTSLPIDTTPGIGNEGIGLAEPKMPMNALASRSTNPFDNTNMLGKIGLIIQGFGAGGMGQTPLYSQLQTQEIEKRKLKQSEMLHQMEVAEKLSKTAAPLRGEERKKFIDNAVNQYAKDDPGFADVLRMSINRPDIISTLPAYAKSDQVLMSLVNAGDTEGVHKYVTSEVGRKSLSQAANGVYIKEFTSKLSPIVDWYEKNDPQTLERIRADGLVSVAELRELHDKAPLNLQMSPEAFANVTAPEHQDALAGFTKLKITPDKESIKSNEWKMGEIGVGEDKVQSIFYNPIDPLNYKKVGEPRKKSGQQIDVSVSTEKKYGEQFAGQVAKSDSELRDTAGKAPNLAERANQIKQIIASGNVATGIGADFKVAFGKAAAAAGIKGAEDYASNSEVLSASLAQNTLDAIKASGLGSGSGFSNTDREFLEKAVGGKITWEPKSIEFLADLAHRAAEQSAKKWNKRVKEIPDSALDGTGITRDEVTVAPLFKKETQTPANGWSIKKKEAK
jgi:hypothetical protein